MSQNRPFKFGTRDRREYIVQDSEVALVTINDTNGNPIFLGRAKPGTALDAEAWQIRKIAYDSNQGVTRITWPEGSTEYLYTWSEFDKLNITGITQADPAVVTVEDIGDLQNGDLIVIQDVSGMTAVNFSGENIYEVQNITGNSFELKDVDSSGFSAYVSGGTVDYSNVVNLEYK